ncbi:hypothetical protein QO001_003013 [Methylobacterium brachiatum]|uniref:DUF308 domain-containing protein n=1 Tax=Methylobacterium brachiatum TaxID=269660 RepID=A0AAJ1TSL3_9HYPH|nr:hypothetical protein [Methylobacterium brachiatum]MCB4803354.1 hypothetical protein [Methylobacterium brachiatum]MDQ0544084.1 hypothetical protein [Methylobacterium brachiatum]
MIAALFALAAAMAIGGCAAVIQGFPYVRLESGLAMVIAGSVAASSGAVLFGISVLALVFRRLERVIGQRPALAPAEAGPVTESAPRLPPVLPAAPAFIVPPIVEPPFDPERPRIEPNLRLLDDTPSTPVEPPRAAEPQRPTPVESDFPIQAFPAAPIVEPEPPHRPAPEAAPAPAAERSPEDDLFAAPEAPPQPAPPSEPPALRPSLDAAPEPEPEPKPDTRTVVGRYASGGNTYVMFEDGSIEAETPQGRFTFASLDELKAFVDGGGESGTRGAA